MSQIIRSASENDIPQIINLIKELALYEKAPEEVINTPEQMKKDGFGDNPLFKCMVVENDIGIFGFALYYYRYSTWKGKVLYLEDFYIKEKYRKTGIGQKLFNEVIKTAKHDNCKRICWQVLEWNEPAINFYKKYNAGFDKEWWNGFIEL